MNMYGYVYKTTNLTNGKIYVGQKKSNNFIPTYFGSGTLIKRAIEKYGIDNFKVEMIDSSTNADELDEKEIFWIKELKSKCEYGNYNIADGGYLARYDFNEQPEWRKEEIRQKLSKVNLGRKRSPETRKLISKIQTGRKQSKETCELKSKLGKERLKNNPELYNKVIKNLKPKPPMGVNVYEHGVLVHSFESAKECLEYFKKNGLSKNPLYDNLLRGKPICPFKERPSNMGFRVWEARQRYKDYQFVYAKDDVK